MTTSLLLVSEQPVLCKWLATLIKPAGYVVYSCCATLADALSHVMEHRPQLILIDARFGGNRGFDVARQLMLANLVCRCIVIVPLSPDFIEQAFRSDISGYLPENPDEEEVLACLDVVRQRRRYISPTLTAYLKLPLAVASYDMQRLRDLSQREKEILHLLYQGLKTPEMAEKLGVAISTINTHKQNMVEKLQLKNRQELMVVAVQLVGSSS